MLWRQGQSDARRRLSDFFQPLFIIAVMLAPLRCAARPSTVASRRFRPQGDDATGAITLQCLPAS